MQIADEAHAAGVALVARVIETLRTGNQCSRVSVHYGCSFMGVPVEINLDRLTFSNAFFVWVSAVSIGYFPVKQPTQ